MTYNKLREIFRLPPFEAVTLGLAGDFTQLVEWAQDSRVTVLPFTFDEGKRVRLDLVPNVEAAAVGTVCKHPERYI